MRTICFLLFFPLIVLVFPSCSKTSRKKIDTPSVQAAKTDSEQQEAITTSLSIDHVPPLTTSEVPPAHVTTSTAANLGPLFPLPHFFGPGFSDDEGTNISDDNEDNDCDCCDCDLATSGRGGGPDTWYEIITLAYPEDTPLSLNRNIGNSKGNIELTPTGLIINEAGTYWASISAILTNNNIEYTPLITYFLVPVGVFDPLNTTSQIGGAGNLPYQQIVTLQTDGILFDVPAGTEYSIIASNGGSPQPDEVTVVGWSISLYKICD